MEAGGRCPLPARQGTLYAIPTDACTASWMAARQRPTRQGERLSLSRYPVRSTYRQARPADASCITRTLESQSGPGRLTGHGESKNQPVWQFGRRRRLQRQIGAERDRLYRIAWSWCRDSYQADDLVQETLARALAKVDNLREESRLQVWLTRSSPTCIGTTVGRNPRRVRTPTCCRSQDDPEEYYRPHPADHPNPRAIGLPE